MLCAWYTPVLVKPLESVMRFPFDGLKVGLVRCTGAADILICTDYDDGSGLGLDWDIDEIDLKFSVDAEDNEVPPPSMNEVATALADIEGGNIARALIDHHATAH
jgi:hypothetical protein